MVKIFRACFTMGRRNKAKSSARCLKQNGDSDQETLDPEVVRQQMKHWQKSYEIEEECLRYLRDSDVHKLTYVDAKICES